MKIVCSSVGFVLVQLFAAEINESQAFKGTPPDLGKLTQQPILKEGPTVIEHVINPTPLSAEEILSTATGSSIDLAEKTGRPFVSRHATERKRWGIDKSDDAEYWYNHRIHTFGNTGFFGGLHAAVAPIATKMIDTFAYEGQDARSLISKQLHQMVHKKGARVLDMCCGVGISTRALRSAFHDAETVIGLDTSPEMISMARVINRHEVDAAKMVVSIRSILDRFFEAPYEKTKLYLEEVAMKARGMATSYVMGNAQQTEFPEKSFDLVTIMYAFHEAPRFGRYLMIREARRLLQPGGTLALIDICPTYKPSATMLAGEPYVLEYQKNIKDQMKKLAGFADITFKPIVPGHVVMWTLTRKAEA